MKAMILAAGRGTRLRPITDTCPKALVEIEGRPLLSIVLDRLIGVGVREVIINLHHFGEQIEAWIGAHPFPDLRVTFSREESLLDTGGGLKQAAWFFDEDQPFLVHNVDVLSDIDLRAMVAAHEASGALATLAVKSRPTTRHLLFDEAGALCGRRGRDGDRVVRTPQGGLLPLGFCGIHVVSPALLNRLDATGAFSIVDRYLSLASSETIAPVRAYRVDGYRWRDAGRPEDLRAL